MLIGGMIRASTSIILLVPSISNRNVCIPSAEWGLSSLFIDTISNFISFKSVLEKGTVKAIVRLDPGGIVSVINSVKGELVLIKTSTLLISTNPVLVTLKERAISPPKFPVSSGVTKSLGCQYAFKIDPLCALNFDPPYV